MVYLQVRCSEVLLTGSTSLSLRRRCSVEAMYSKEVQRGVSAASYISICSKEVQRGVSDAEGTDGADGCVVRVCVFQRPACTKAEAQLQEATQGAHQQSQLRPFLWRQQVIEISIMSRF